MNSISNEEAVSRARRLISVYERKKITANTLVSEIAGFATPETVNAIMEALTPEAQALFERWIPTLPDDDYKGVVFWPLPQGVTPAFKNWLSEHRRNGAAVSQQVG